VDDYCLPNLVVHRYTHSLSLGEKCSLFFVFLYQTPRRQRMDQRFPGFRTFELYHLNRYERQFQATTSIIELAIQCDRLWHNLVFQRENDENVCACASVDLLNRSWDLLGGRESPYFDRWRGRDEKVD
jgi:hypothetical protein